MARLLDVEVVHDVDRVADHVGRRLGGDEDVRRRVPEIPADLDVIVLAGGAVRPAAHGILSVGRQHRERGGQTENGHGDESAHVKNLGPGMNERERPR